jgi:glyoxylase-like metal-dependent hydrolase (beta-lactamase superfamily II)
MGLSFPEVPGMKAGFAAVLALVAAPVLAQPQDFSKVEIKAEKVAEGLYVLFGSGGNIGVSVGKSGTYVIDDQYAPLTDKILAAIRAITPEPVRFVVNTHWHGDHTGGNDNMGKSGTLLVAHESVRRRMSTDQFMALFDRKVPASPEAALPVVTFSDAITFHWNGDEIRVYHVPPAHTDTDSIVQFVKADVVHMGDLYNGKYPFIDLSSGGAVDGLISAADRALAGTGPKTRFIPGHGPVGTRADRQGYRDMLKTLRDRVAALEAAGKTRDEVVAAKPTADHDARWASDFMKGDVFAGILYDSLK